MLRMSIDTDYDMNIDSGEEFKMNMDSNEQIHMDMEPFTKVSEKDYEKLANLPTLNGKQIVGNIDEEDPTVPEWAKQQSKPTYTAEEVGSIAEGNTIPLSELQNIIDTIF